MIAVRAAIPWRLILGGLGEREHGGQLLTHFFGIDVRRIGTGILKPKSKLVRSQQLLSGCAQLLDAGQLKLELAR